MADPIQFPLPPYKTAPIYELHTLPAGSPYSVNSGNSHFKGYYNTDSELTTAYPSAESGDYAIVGTTDTIWIWDSDTLDWVDTDTKGPVDSVNGKTGDVNLTKTDIGLSNVDNTSDLNKPISTAAQTALNGLDGRIDTLETTVGDASSGLVKQVTTNTNAIASKATQADLNALNTRVTDLETTVGDASSGLVKAVSDKQDSNAPTLTTSDKTIVGAINEIKSVNDSQATSINNLQSQLNLDHPTNTISAFVITPASDTVGTSITDGSGAAAAGKGGKVIVSPTITNVGAVYVTTELTKPTALPIYPNTIVEFGPYADLSDVLVYVDSLGDSVSIQINYV